MPPLPAVGGAHEYTLAALLALLGGAAYAGTSLVPGVGPSLQIAAISGPGPSNAGPTTLPSVSPAPVAPVRVIEPSTVQPGPAPAQPTLVPARPPTAVAQANQQQAPASPVLELNPATSVDGERVSIRSATNVRTAPNGSAPAVRTTARGTVLREFERGAGGWVKVGDAQPWGWVHSSLLAPPP